MHDIGKVKTPIEILNKPDKLTDDEFAIMKRHIVDGAEILRRTPDMPTLAPIVAFEHHLRLDGTGYPNGVMRASLNLGTMLCSIADVYDAMRSQREYQQAFPDRSHPGGAEAQRRQAVRSAPRAALRAADRHLPGGQPRAAEHGEIAVVLRVTRRIRTGRASAWSSTAMARRDPATRCDLWERRRGGPGPGDRRPVDPRGSRHRSVDTAITELFCADCCPPSLLWSPRSSWREAADTTPKLVVVLVR